MLRSQKRLLLLLAVLPVLLVGASLLYMMGMSTLEDDARSFWQSLAWAAETLSTTGYGSDTNWNHPAMVLFVVMMQFAGVFLIFLIFPIYLIPFLEERFEGRLPTEVEPLSDHVIIVRSTPAISILIEELTAAEIETLVVESDEAEARRLVSQGVRVIHGKLDDGVLERVHLLEARTLVANSSDHEDAAFILSARQMGFVGEVLALVEEPFHLEPMRLAGATEAFSPKSVLGAVLATRASRKVNPAVAGVKALGARLQIGEVRIEAHSELAGRSLSEVDLGKRTNVTVIGLWGRGDLEAPVLPDHRLEAGSVLVVVGSAKALENLGAVCQGTRLTPNEGAFIVAGHGEVGREVARYLREAGEMLIIVDREPGPNVDVVGNVLDPATLEESGVKQAQGVILALDTDSATLFATVVLKELAPQVPIFARVNRVENLKRIYGVGAQFAQALGEVSSHILSERMLGKTSLSLSPQLEVFQVEAGVFTGCHPKALGIRERTGCSVVAIERGNEVFTRFDDELELDSGDLMTLCGSKSAAETFRDVFETD